MKKLLLLTALSVAVTAAPAWAQRGGHGGGSHGGGSRVGGSHGGGSHGGGFRGGYGTGHYGGYGRGYGPSLSFGFGEPYYPPYYGPMYSPYYYGAPYPYDYSDSEDLDDMPPPPPPVYDQRPVPSRQWQVRRGQSETDYELPDSVLFGLDSARINPDADAVLKEIADAARDQPDARLVVEGHTDTSGSHDHNMQLSDARARAVAAALARQGVARARIQTEGLGETQLAVDTGDGVREARNRRVVVRLLDGARDQDDQPPPR